MPGDAYIKVVSNVYLCRMVSPAVSDCVESKIVKSEERSYVIGWRQRPEQQRRVQRDGSPKGSHREEASQTLS